MLAGEEVEAGGDTAGFNFILLVISEWLGQDDEESDFHLHSCCHQQLTQQDDEGSVKYTL